MLKQCYTPRINLYTTTFRRFSMTKEFDVAVIGGGPGGYTAAIRAAQKGLKTVCIDSGDSIGGTGVNSGCIPSKALLNYTSRLRDAQIIMPSMGIEMQNLRPNFDKMQKAKETAVRGCTKRIAESFRKLGVTHMSGWGRFTSPNDISVKLNYGAED